MTDRSGNPWGANYRPRPLSPELYGGPVGLGVVFQHLSVCPDAWVHDLDTLKVSLFAEVDSDDHALLMAYRRARRAVPGWAPGDLGQQTDRVMREHHLAAMVTLQNSRTVRKSPGQSAVIAAEIARLGGVRRVTHVPAETTEKCPCGAALPPHVGPGRPRRYCLTCRPRRASTTSEKVARYGC